MKKILLFAFAFIFIAAFSSSVCAGQCKFRVGNGYSEIHQSVVEDGLTKGKPVVAGYGEDKRLDPTAIKGNEWFAHGAKPKTEDEVKKVGEWYRYPFPPGAKMARVATKSGEYVDGFRFNTMQLNQGLKPNVYSQLHKHEDELCGHYIVYPDPFDSGKWRNGYFVPRSEIK